MPTILRKSCRGAQLQPCNLHDNCELDMGHVPAVQRSMSRVTCRQTAPARFAPSCLDLRAMGRGASGSGQPMPGTPAASETATKRGKRAKAKASPNLEEQSATPKSGKVEVYANHCAWEWLSHGSADGCVCVCVCVLQPEEAAPFIPAIGVPLLKVESPLDKAKQLAKVILKQSSEARELALTLSTVKYGGDLEKQLNKHHATVEDLYHKLSQLIREKCVDDKRYEPLLTTVRPRVARLAWHRQSIERNKAGCGHGQLEHHAAASTIAHMLHTRACLQPLRTIP